MSEQLINTQHAIETIYRKFLFRSRLEAKWAVFFDLCGWPWSYEPLDFNGWIPDFAIGEHPTLVEVKPFFKREEWGDAIAKIEASGCRRPVILLGADPTILGMSTYENGALIIGNLWEWNGECGESWELCFGQTEGNGMLGLCSLEGAWWNAIWEFNTGDHDNKKSRVYLSDEDREQLFVSRWAEACNQSRWIPTR